jgi:maleylacetoacetate isomerase
MLLYDYFRSSAAYRVRIALNLKGVKPGQKSIHLRKGEQRGADYKSVNPQGLVPTLELDDGTRLTQSLAIMEWLDEKYPEPPLLPRDSVARAHCRAIALAIACDIHPLNNTRVLAYLEKDLALDQETRDTWYRHWIIEGFTAIEAQLRGVKGKFACGDQPTIADICIVPQVANAHRVKTPLDAFPRIREVNDNCLKLKAFADARPESHPHAE